MPTPTTSTVTGSETGGSVGPDETLTVAQGGTTVDFTVSGSFTYDPNTPPYFIVYSAIEDVSGVASSSTISSEGFQLIESGGVAYSTQLAGGTQYISSGALPTIRPATAPKWSLPEANRSTPRLRMAVRTCLAAPAVPICRFRIKPLNRAASQPTPP